jgi:hypothetical protein
MQQALALFAAGSALLVNIAAQVLVHRFPVHGVAPEGRLVLSLLTGFLGGSATFVLAVALLRISVGPDDDIWWHAAAALLIYIAGSFSFLCLVSAGETSVRVEILRQLKGRATGLTLQELDAAYANSILIRTRLDRLIEAHAIRIDRGRYQLASKPLLIVASAFRLAKLVLFGVTNEFGLPSNWQSRSRDRAKGGRPEVTPKE